MLKCRLCGSSTVKDKFVQPTEWGTFKVYSCTSCTAEFIDPATEVDDRTIQAHFFDENPYTESRAGVLARYWRKEAAFVESLGPISGKVLDVGCNSGDFLDALNPVYEKYGVELAPEPAKQAMNKGIVIYDKPIEECEFAGQTFDIITMFALIEHLRYPEETIERLSALLNPGGMLVIMTGDASALKSTLLGPKWHMYIPPLHRYFFTRRSLKLLCGQFGLQEVDHRYTHGGMTISRKTVLRLAEKATLWQISQFPLLRKAPLYDHYYGYFVKK